MLFLPLNPKDSADGSLGGIIRRTIALYNIGLLNRNRKRKTSRTTTIAKEIRRSHSKNICKKLDFALR
nr:MAG TPA: hypothetical protein [Caudoviricetes sp.]